MKFSIFFSLCLLLFNCVPPPSNPVGIDKRFRTTAPSLLYFKNIRSSSYNTSQNPATRIDYYKLRQWKKQNSTPVFYPTIVNDWMNDAAYIQLQPNTFSGLPKDKIRLEIAGKSHELQLRTDNFIASTDLATQLLIALEAGNKISIKTTDSTTFTLFEDKLEKNSFVTTIKDYLKLVEQR